MKTGWSTWREGWRLWRASTGQYCAQNLKGTIVYGETLEELNENLREVIAMLLDDGEPVLDGEYVGTQVIVVA